MRLLTMSHFLPTLVSFSRGTRASAGQADSFVRAEHYADMVELRALCQIAGPYGLRDIHRVLLSHISIEVGTIKVSSMWHMLDGLLLHLACF